jgi:hypothetical protein
MGQSEEKPKTVEELRHFPVETFRAFKKGYLEGIITIGVDRAVAFQWAQGGLHSSPLLRAQTLILSWLPFIAAIAFLIYAVFSKSWSLLLASPVLLIGFFVFHPGAAVIFGFVRSLFILLTVVGFGWALLSDRPGLLVLTSALLVIWFSQRTVYSSASRRLLATLAEHEDLLCLLWYGKAISIRFYNGNTYYSDWKTEDGQASHYDQ